MIKKQVLKHIKLQPCFLKKRLKTKMEIYYKLNFHIKQISGPDSFIYHCLSNLFTSWDPWHKFSHGIILKMEGL